MLSLVCWADRLAAPIIYFMFAVIAVNAVVWPIVTAMEVLRPE